jgi:hypothetical protein
MSVLTNRRLVIAALVAISSIAAGCSEPGVSLEPIFARAQPSGSITISPSELSLRPGDTATLTASVQKANGTLQPERRVTWSTSDAAVATVSDSGLVQAVSLGEAVVAASTSGPKVTTSSIVVRVALPAWTQLQPPGGGPPSRDLYSVHAPDLHAVFVGTMSDYQQGVLWRLNLATDTWAQVPAGNWPIGKYRQLVYDSPNRRLMTYWDGRGQVYAISVDGGSWYPVGTSSNSDEYYEAFTFFNPVSQRLTVFAGYGFSTFKNLLWEWNASSNTWVSLTQSAQRPEPRFGIRPSAVAIDTARQIAYLGQRSLGAGVGNHDDLWSLDLTTRTWTNVIPASVTPEARLASAFALEHQQNRLFRFGGVSLYGLQVSEDFVVAQLGTATTGWTPVMTAGASPAPRYHAGMFYDQPRSRLILVGGRGANGWLSDVWTFDVR